MDGTLKEFVARALLALLPLLAVAGAAKLVQGVLWLRRKDR